MLFIILDSKNNLNESYFAFCPDILVHVDNRKGITTILAGAAVTVSNHRTFLDVNTVISNMISSSTNGNHKLKPSYNLCALYNLQKTLEAGGEMGPYLRGVNGPAEAPMYFFGNADHRKELIVLWILTTCNSLGHTKMDSWMVS